jgi:3-hydroxyisobutyrate dehydrogenase and related beta-hydroxyacid dehydrogenases
MPQLDGSNPNHRIGVIGLGTVGEDLARRLVAGGHSVNAYDKDRRLLGGLAGAYRCGSLRELFEASTYVLGCTGEDLLNGATWLSGLQGDRILASCSSEDVEFRSLLRRSAGSAHLHPFKSVEIRLPHGSIKVLRGGFPANFTGAKNSGPIALIQVTRALLLAGVFQAARLVSGPFAGLPRRIMLDPELQAIVGRAFITRRRKRLLDPQSTSVLDVDWVERHSTGIRLAADW